MVGLCFNHFSIDVDSGVVGTWFWCISTRGAQSRRSCPLGPDSDGFMINRLRVEEGALGDPVLAGNQV
jgi:hypothetical protein